MSKRPGPGAAREDDHDGRLAKLLQTLKGSPDDQDAWVKLDALMRPGLLAKAREAVGDDDADDVCQQVFERLAPEPRFEELQEPSRFRAHVDALLQAVIADVCEDNARLEDVRREQRSPTERLRPSDLLQIFLRAQYGTLPEEHERLADALQALPPGDLDLLERRARVATLTEFAAQERVSYSVARTRVHRATWRLRRLLGLIPGGPPL